MDAAGYTTLTRQSGLMREMQAVANNIANMSTTGFRREGVIFQEYIVPLENGPSLSMANGDARSIDLSQGGLSRTDAALDLAIQGEGFFQIQTPDGPRLTRAGSFTTSATDELVTFDGFRVLDEGGAPISLQGSEGQLRIAEDGTISTSSGPIAKLGLWQPTDPLTLTHQAGTMFSSSGVQPLENGKILQGFVEDSNVNPIQEVARMVEVQRAYEMGQSFSEQEDKRMRGVIETLGR